MALFLAFILLAPRFLHIECFNTLVDGLLIEKFHVHDLLSLIVYSCRTFSSSNGM